MVVHGGNRVPLVLATTGLILFLGALLHQVNGVPSSWTSSIGRVTGYACIEKYTNTRTSWLTFDSSSRPSFYDIALSYGTDKVTKHHYHHIYQKYLEPYRDKPIKMLEIGLGCDMSYGPGASFYTWLDYLPHVDLYFIEYDAACAQKWAANTTAATIYPGDQANVTFLNSFMASAGTDFDFIIDDGGHQMYQQITSLQVLYQAVKPGGIYFCEDLQTSYWEDYGGDRSNSGKKKTMMGMVKELVDDLNVGPGGHERRHEVSGEMQGIDCMEEVCAFVKKG